MNALPLLDNNASRPAVLPLPGPSSSATIYPEQSLGKGITAQIVLVTAEIATELLAKRMEGQRSIKAMSLSALIDDIDHSRFLFNGEPILIDWYGRLIDGQHRLVAIIRTGKPQEILIVRGLDPEVYRTLDGGSKRLNGDALKQGGCENARDVAAAIKLVRRYEQGLIPGKQLVVSQSATQEFLRGHRDIEECVPPVAPLGRMFGRRATWVFCYFILSRIDAEDAAFFFSRVASGANLPEHHPILALRNRFASEKSVTDTMIHYIFKAWNAYRQKKSIKQLRIGIEETLPVPV